MNIFEQYGIKEVADCTLYAIERDKYDEEIYIPIMYFDTLKVSTIEQATSQVSARGGQGNPEQIIWDYGKEITINIEDALYTPASQSLMWGAKYGLKNTRIRGVWNPIEYKDDYFYYEILFPQSSKINDYGETELFKTSDSNENIYSFQKKFVNSKGAPIETEESEKIEYKTEEDLESYTKFINPITNDFYYFKICIDDKKWEYKYKYKNEENLNNNTFISYPTHKIETLYGDAIIENGTVLRGYYIKDLINLDNWENQKRPEIAEILIENFNDFSLDKISDNDIEFYDYKWKDIDLKLISLEGDRDTYFMENCGLSFKTKRNFLNKYVSFSGYELIPTEYDEVTEEWKELERIEPIIINPLDRVRKSKLSFKKKTGKYSPKIDFTIFTYIQNPFDGKEYEVLLPIGTFYVIMDWNSDGETSQDSIYPIEKGFTQERYIEKFEKQTAHKTFAIDTDTNLIHSNFRLLQKYQKSELTIFIDPKSMKPYTPNSDKYITEKGETLYGNFRIIKEGELYLEWSRTKAPDYSSNGTYLIIDANHFPGTYKLVGETYKKDRTGKNHHYQFEIPLAKMSTENKLTLEAEGEPTTFSFKLKALRKRDGVMMKITEYETECDITGNKVIPTDSIEDPYVTTELADCVQTVSLELVEPRPDARHLVTAENNTKTINSRAKMNYYNKLNKNYYSKDNLKKIGKSDYLEYTIRKDAIYGIDYNLEFDILDQNQEGGDSE